MKMKRLLFLSKISLLLLYVSAYSGESENADDSESELSGDSSGFDTACLPLKKVGKYLLFGKFCSLQSAFIAFLPEMDLNSFGFLHPQTVKCTSFSTEGKYKKLICTSQSFEILPPGEGNQIIKNVKMILKTNDTSYKNTEIIMSGDQNAKVTKQAGSNDIQVDLSVGNSILVEEYLRKHFGVNYIELSASNKSNGLFPSMLNEVKLTAVLNPNHYVEVIFWDDENSFFIFQKFENSTKPSVGFFKKITSKDKDRLQFINKRIESKMNPDFLNLVKSSYKCFSSCTSEIPIIMSSKHRNLTKDFITEMNTVLMPEGATLQWRQTAHKLIKSDFNNNFSNGIVDVLPNEIGYSALFSQKEGMSKVYSYDNITGSFLDVISNFFIPNTTFNDEPYASLLQKTVVFKELVFNGNSASLSCEVDENWDIVNNLVNLTGMNLTFEVKEDNWEVSGNGDALVLGRTVVADIEERDKSFYLIGEFSVKSINELTSAANNVSFLPESHKNFEHLKDLPFSSLQLETSLDSDVLKFKGVSLSYANAKNNGSSSNTSLEIILYNEVVNNQYEVRMVVGICQNNVLFEKFFEEVLNVTLEGVPWLAFENLCFLIAKEKDGFLNKHFDTPELKDFEEPGIHFSGKISFPNCEKEGENKQDICYFIQNNSEIFSTFGKGKGSISQASFEFITKSDKPICKLNLTNTNLTITNPSIHLKEVFQNTYETVITSENKTLSTVNRHHKKHTKHHKKQEVQPFKQANTVKKPDNIRMIGLSVEGDIKYLNSSFTFTSKGIITSFDSGQLVLSVNDAYIKLSMYDESNSKTRNSKKQKIVEFKANEGKSVAKENVFSFFEFVSQINVTLNHSTISFKNGSRLTFDIKEPRNTLFFSAIETEELSSVQSIFKKFKVKRYIQTEEFKFVFKGAKFLPSPLFVWTVKDSKIVQAGNRTAQNFSLTMFGYLNRSEKINEFKFKLGYCTLKYQEWLSVTNLSNSNLQLFHKNDYLKGPQLVVRWHFCNKQNNTYQKQISLKGSVQTIGISGISDIELNYTGHFKIENTATFFGEVEASFCIEQKNNFSSFQEINPSFYVNLISDKNVTVHIKEKVKEYVNNLVEKVSKAYEGEEFLESKKNAENLAYLPASNLANILQSISQMINIQIGDIKVVENTANVNCVETCKKAGIVEIPYIVQKSEENKVMLQLVPNYFKTQNVTCIADCEINKMASSENFEKILDDVKKRLQVFDKLSNEAKEICNMYTKYDESVNSKVENFKTERLALESLTKFLLKMENPARDFFTLNSFNILEEKLGNVKMCGENCVDNFRVSYNMFGVKKEMVFRQCFNGEFATYFAKKVFEHYLDESITKDIEKLWKLHSTYIAKQEEDLKLLETSLADFYEKYSNPVHAVHQPIIAQRTDLLHHFNRKKTLVFNTRTLDLPHISAKDRAILDMNQITVTRSMETRKAFLYSSPWASLSVFNPESLFKKPKVFVRGLPSNMSSCNAVTDIGNQYADMYKSIRSISDSYVYSIDHLKGIYESMQKETNFLKNSNVGTSKETKEEQLYWVRQLERGIHLFSELMEKKLSTYSASALTAFKSTFESALKRNGVRSIASFMRRLKNQLQMVSTFDSTKRAKGLSSASKLTDAMAAIFSNPFLKLDEVTDRIKAMKKYITNIDGMVRSCKSSYI